jgi:phosphatidylinositol alpha-1,6-mannosyltransferase
VRWADAIVAVSAHARELAVSAGADPHRIEIIHPGVDLPAADPAPIAERPGPPRIVTVARADDEHKGHERLLRALPLVRDRIPEVRWSVVGEGRLLPGLRALSAGLGVDDRVEFLGGVSDERRDALLDGAHVFAMLSRAPRDGAGEGFGMVFVEAGARGLPVVAGRAPGVVDAVLDGRTGVLVDPDDPRSAADALVEVLSSPARAASLAAAGRARAADLAWPAVAGRYRDLVGRVDASPRRATAATDRTWVTDLVRGVPAPRHGG